MPVTGMFLSYQQRDFVADALKSVLAQDYPMELIISDDGSSDGTRDVVERIAARYEGHHSVMLRSPHANVGLVRHINDVARIARGRLLVLFAGDDISAPNRVRMLADAVLLNPSIKLIGSSHVVIDSTKGGSGEGGCARRTESWGLAEVLSGRDYFLPGATVAFDRDVFFTFGPLNESLYAEDMALGFRSLMLGRIATVEAPLVHYRLVSGSLSKIALAYGDSLASFRASHAARLGKVLGIHDEFSCVLNQAIATGLVGAVAAVRLRRRILRPIAAAERFHRTIVEGRRSSWIGPSLLAAISSPALAGQATRAIAVAISIQSLLWLRRMRATAARLAQTPLRRRVR